MSNTRCRTICWAPIWNRDREGLGLEHLLLAGCAADSSGFRAELPVDEDGIVVGYPGLFRRVQEDR